MEQITLEAKKRSEIGKRVKKVRKDGFIPAVIYGRNVDPIPISLEKLSATQILNKISSSTVLNLKIDGKDYAALVRDVQRDHIRNEFLHLDFLAVSLTEKLRTTVTISLVGEAPVLKEYEALIVPGISEVEVEALPQDLPEMIEVDISTLSEIGDAIYLKDIPVPANIKFLTDGEELIAVASSVKEEEEELAEVAEEELEVEEKAEPEVIEHGKIREDEEEEK